LDNLEVSCRQRCNECSYKLTHQIDYKKAPEILEYPCTNIKSSHKIKIKIEDEYKVLFLRGVIYHDKNHFCSRIVLVELKTCNRKILVLAIYA